ncbi:hypothetical protein DPMN_107666 [Dreissena polymorpha]|uniref:Uncharacterized protein n=1 Tax=Dreissena polymorpha TaxID=45954 RepID=A0A9D4QK27_DREPO|nr:hypothetical protein DPMN_107666 [Dreissena polymorpha]
MDTPQLQLPLVSPGKQQEHNEFSSPTSCMHVCLKMRDRRCQLSLLTTIHNTVL